MLKHTGEDHPDRALLEKAITTISQVALHINEHIRERENMVALREIDREIGNGSEQLTDNPSRVFIHRGDLVKRSRKTDSAYHLWLCSDILLYQKKSFGPKTVYNKPPKRIEIKTLSVLDVADSESETPFAFELRSQSKSFRVFASDQQDKDRWVRFLQEAIEQATGGKAGLSSKEVAPVWEQDTPMCNVCEAAFSFLFRRHHCRACGRCVCDKCSRNRMFLRNLDENKEVRVCNPCFETLSGPSNSSVKRNALTSAIASSSRRGSSPAPPIMPKLATLGMGGSKRSQAEASVSALSPRAAATHASMVDMKQVSLLSQEMAERRRQRDNDTSFRSESSTRTLESSTRTLDSSSRTFINEASFRSDVSTRSIDSSSRVLGNDSSFRSEPSARSIDRMTANDALLPREGTTDSSGSASSPILSSIPQPKAALTKSASASKASTSSSSRRPSVVLSSAGKAASDSVLYQKGVEDSPEREAMGEVLQQIRREVPLEAPKPMHIHEVPKPLPVARIASPAQLSPMSSPRITARPPSSVDVTMSSMSSVATPASVSSATPASVKTASPSPSVKPPTPARRPSLNKLTNPSMSSPLVSSGSPLRTGGGKIGEEVKSDVPVKKTPPTAPPKASSTDDTSTPPPLPKRRPSSFGSTGSDRLLSPEQQRLRLKRNESSQSSRSQDTDDTAGFDML